MALDQATPGGNGTLGTNANPAPLSSIGRRSRSADASGSIDQDTSGTSGPSTVQKQDQGSFQAHDQDQETYQEGYQQQGFSQETTQGQRKYDPNKIFQTFMEGNNVHARLRLGRVKGPLRVVRDLDIDLRPKGQIDQKIVRDSLVTGAMAGAVIGLTMGAKAGLASLIGTAAATMLVKVCEVDVRIAGEQDAQPLLSFQPTS